MKTLVARNRCSQKFEGQPWHEVQLGEMGTVISGGTPDSSNPEYWGGNIHWATQTDITKLTSRFIGSTARKISKAGLKSSAAKLLPEGAILICTQPTTGELAIATGPICTNQGFKNLVLSKDYDSDFVFYLLQFFKNELIRYACGSTFLGLSKKDFEERTFVVPGIEEQRKIAGILSSVDKVIENTQKQIDKLQGLKKATMNELLTGGIGHKEFKDCKLGEMGNVLSGGTPDSSNPEYWGGNIHWATPTDITKLTSRFIRSTARKISETGLKSSTAKLVPKGAILVCTRATIGELAIATSPICTNQGFKNLVLSRDYNSDFIFYLLQFFKNELIRYACGSTFLELSKKDFEKRTFKVPGVDKQRKIAGILTSVDRAIENTQKRIDKFRDLKKSLMQDLLTGKVRVKVN